ncbi:MAG: glycosyltransferase family 39 protein [Leptospirales bacterium]|nr:glycosyltransferase family 39 protein [Leptospirales bacterium]
MKERTTGSQHSSKILLALSILLLVLLVRINYTILPFTWPDEALFSSPATELAEGRPFATKVLSGLIYGMDRATLWNGPLYMTLLSVVYQFTGESQLAGRTFSLVLGIGALAVFFLLTRRLTTPFIAGLAAIILALDPVFQRASNTIRMDVLTLLLLLIAIYLSVGFSRAALTPIAKGTTTDKTSPESSSGSDKKRLLMLFLAGVAAGLAGTSHPFAVIAIPVLFILLFPVWKELLLAAIGILVGFAPWGIYILRNLDLFKEQFIPQLQRKEDFVRMLTGGETGGVLNVYFSQYGFSPGSWPAMVIGALLYCFVFLVLAIFLWKLYRSGLTNLLSQESRILFCFIAISGFALISSEGWYVVYGDVLLILCAAILWNSRSQFNGQQDSWPLFQSLFTSVLPVALGTMLILSGYFTIRHAILKTHQTAQAFIQATVKDTAICETVYLRVRPDPYFLIRTERPQTRVLEFIPGKLRISPARVRNLIETLDTVDCFLIDRNKSWEPLLTNYLHERSGKFQVHPIRTQFPLSDVDLYVRKKHGN